MEENVQEYDSMVKAKPKKTRKVLTDHGTYLFYDDDAYSASNHSSQLDQKSSVASSKSQKLNRGLKDTLGVSVRVSLGFQP